MFSGWKLLSAIGQGVILSLSFTGLVRIGYWAMGRELSPSIAGNLFLLSSLLTGALCGYCYVRTLKKA